MSARDVIVIGASTGGLDPLIQLVGGLPRELAAAIFVVSHLPADAVSSRLPEVLERRTGFAAAHATPGGEMTRGRILVAPPDHHLELGPQGIRLERGPRENGFRPAIDPLFVSAARTFGARTIGVLLSGALADGVAGLMAIRRAGGVAVVQDPDDAEVPDLLERARELAGADHVVPAAAMGPLLARLVAEPVTAAPFPSAGPASLAGSAPVPQAPPRAESVIAASLLAQRRGDHDGQTAPYTCPDCGGALWQLGSGGALRFRCHLGHAVGGEHLVSSKGAALEAALWVAVRTFRERAMLSRQLAEREQQESRLPAAERFAARAEADERNANAILRLLSADALPAG